jgi:NDP-sugar pyrophosphorylase family protein
MIKALVLAAGRGTRLRPLTEALPKPMLRLGGKPLLQHIIELLRDNGVEEIAVNLHHLPEAITGYFGDGSRLGVQLHYGFEPELLGTAGAVNNFRDFLDTTFIVYYGDCYTRANLRPLLDLHRRKNSLATISVYEVDNPWECGIVTIDGKGRVTRFEEKPPRDKVSSHLANAGIYVLEKEGLDYIPREGFSDFGFHVLPAMLAEQKDIFAFKLTESLIDIGSIEKYKHAARIFFQEDIQC